MLKRITLLILLLCLVGQTVGAEELTSAKAADIKKLIYATGGVAGLKPFLIRFTKLNMAEFKKRYKKENPDIPERAFEIMEKEIVTFILGKIEEPGGLFDLLVKPFHNCLNHQEILHLIAFYESPIGKKYTSILPNLTKESMQVAPVWVQSLMPQFREHLIKAFKREGLLADH